MMAGNNCFEYKTYKFEEGGTDTFSA